MRCPPTRADLKPDFQYGSLTLKGFPYTAENRVGNRVYYREVIAARCQCGKAFLALTRQILHGDSNTCGAPACVARAMGWRLGTGSGRAPREPRPRAVAVPKLKAAPKPRPVPPPPAPKPPKAYAPPSVALRLGQARGALKTQQLGKTGRPAATPERVPNWKAWTATTPPPALTAAERCARQYRGTANECAQAPEAA